MLEANEIDIIVTVTKVSEGWDVQTLRCAIWYAPTLSPAKNLQGNGRIMRTITGENLDKYPEKDRGNTIIIEPSEWQIQ
jgi:superfamily II DNA or RNA helicase